MENKEIEELKNVIKILKNDLKTYGAKNKKVAEYDLQQIEKYEKMLEKLED